MSYQIKNIETHDYEEKKYQYVGPLQDGLALVQNDERLYGYIDESGVEVIPCQYQSADHFSEGLACVKKVDSNYFEYIDVSGKTKIRCPEKYISARSFHNGRAVVATGKHQYGYIDKEGIEVIPCEYYDARDFSEGLAIVDTRELFRKRSSRSIHVGCPPARLRFIDEDGTIQRKLNGNYRFFGSDAFHNGLMPVEEYGRYSEAIGGHYMIPGFIDKEGTLYTDKSEVERLKRRYEQKPTLKKIEMEPIRFGSKVTFLGKTIDLKSDTKMGLIQKKKALAQELKAAIQEFESLLEEKPKEKKKV